MNSTFFSSHQIMIVISFYCTLLTGFPAPWIYQLCNCLSMKFKGVPACSVQPYFQGIAVSISENSNALLFDPEVELKFYDGYFESELTDVSGDVWLPFSLIVAVPKLFPASVNDFICAPGGGGEKPKANNPFKFVFEGSLFIENDINSNTGDGELLVLGVLDTIDVIVKGFIEINVGTAAIALRVRSSNPDCFPSGIFLNAKINPTISLKGGILPFLSLKSSSEQNIQAGFTWLDTDKNIGPEDYLQSFFYSEERDFNFLGMSGSSKLEIQYFATKEFERRQDFDFNKCCPANNCIVRDQVGFAKVITDNTDAFSANPTFAIYAEMSNMDILQSTYFLCIIMDPSMNLLRSYMLVYCFLFLLVVFFTEVSLVIIVQTPGGDNVLPNLFVKFRCNIEVLVVKLESEVNFAMSDEGAFADFEGKVTLEGGDVLGTAIVTIYAKAEIGDYLLNTPERRRQLMEIDNTNGTSRELSTSLLNADFDLDLDFDYQPAQWMTDLANAVADTVVEVWNTMKYAFNAVTEFVEEAFKQIVEWGKKLGEEISQVFDAIGGAIDEASEKLDDTIDGIVRFLDNNDAGALGDILEVFGDVAGFALDVVSTGFKVAGAIFSGDFDAIGDMLWDLFSSSEYKRTENPE